jgi:hypothetical protein
VPAGKQAVLVVPDRLPGRIICASTKTTGGPDFVQQEVEKLMKTAIEYPPMQKGASFNLDAVKAKIEAARAAMGK